MDRQYFPNSPARFRRLALLIRSRLPPPPIEGDYVATLTGERLNFRYRGRSRLRLVGVGFSLASEHRAAPEYFHRLH